MPRQRRFRTTTPLVANGLSITDSGFVSPCCHLVNGELLRGGPRGAIPARGGRRGASGVEQRFLPGRGALPGATPAGAPMSERFSHVVRDRRLRPRRDQRLLD